MPIERDTVIIVDIESTCWKDKKNPANQRSEIIEIGICTYEIASGKIDNQRGILVQPTESEVSPFCIELTSISAEMLANEGISFESACSLLKTDYQSNNRLWLSWGNYDRRMFMEQCERRGIDYPFADNHCNLKNLFANIYGNRLGMKAALNKIKLDLQGTHHRGVDDAHNIARILHFMLETHGHDLLESFWE
ncbi:MAG: 3'-5' exonuclease [Phototrophicaceae bacterium]